MSLNISATAIKMWINVQTRFNLFVSKLCLSKDVKNFIFLDTYKRKMSEMLQTPEMPLYKDHDLPEHLREVAILTGYRSPSCTARECALSVFCPTNETVNFWTHFVPAFYFLHRLVEFWDLFQVPGDAYYWPLVSYMLTISLYPLMSALAHTFYSVSDMARHVWFFLDYGALSLYAFGSGLLIRAYAFPNELIDTPVVGTCFMEVLVFLCIACSLLACLSRFVDSLTWTKTLRLGAFAIPWLWDQAPVAYRLAFCGDIDAKAAEHLYLHYLFSFCIGFFYASHLPERLAPGRFDLVGNSHQLLHVSGILATHNQLSAALIDLEGRRGVLRPFPSYWSLHVFLLVFFSIMITVVAFTLCAKHYECSRENRTKREN